jgi:predicted PurR-regulated permease PerM
MPEATENIVMPLMPLAPVEGKESPPPLTPVVAQQVLRPSLSYTQKVLVAVGVTVTAILLLMLIFYTRQLLVLCFGGMLFAVFLSAPADLLSNHMRIKRIYALLMVLVVFLGLVGGMGYFLGYTITRQVQQMAGTMNGAIQDFGNDLQRRFVGMRKPLATATASSQSQPASQPGAATTQGAAGEGSAGGEAGEKNTEDWVGRQLEHMRQTTVEFMTSESFFRSAGNMAGDVLTATFGVLGDLLVVAGLGLFFSLNPRRYVQGLLKLVPRVHRERALEVLQEVGGKLQWWFVGQLCSMFTIGVLTFIALTIIGVPMALTLALIAGLANFIPNFGPLIAGTPAVLVALAPDAGAGDHGLLNVARAGWVIVAYVIVQFMEGWVITPFFQAKAVELPPALLVLSQVFLALLLGPLGLIFATPIVVASLVLVRMLYVEDVLGDRGGTVTK